LQAIENHVGKFEIKHARNQPETPLGALQPADVSIGRDGVVRLVGR
jgi:hypothetical protein